jgi:hypothetical protein
MPTKNLTLHERVVLTDMLRNMHTHLPDKLDGHIPVLKQLVRQYTELQPYEHSERATLEIKLLNLVRPIKSEPSDEVA